MAENITLKTTFTDLLKTAMKGRNSRVTSLCRLAKAALEEKATELRSLKTPRDMTEDDAILVIRKMVKRHQDTAAQYQSLGEVTRATEEKMDASWYEGFLPKAPSDADVEAVVMAAAARGLDIGGIMGEVKKAFGPTVDMKKASALARKAIA